ncbi:hypothetical protein [Sphingomonas sp. Leaf37]|uniref:hypothetical protein n=1 Tax=Sphingomonas sp. Leaf37 TaxID=2876552 RepID=UPI001E567217|nr:hypothetical protein [Sphingomonas sp. Leaf37]
MTITTERELQRVSHLVLGRPRPAPALPRKPAGMSKQEWKVEKQRLRDAGQQLVDGVEEHVQLQERWSHKANGTAETHEHAAVSAGREGALLRLVRTGAIDAHQLAAAEKIAEAFAAITAEVTVRTARWGDRNPGGGPNAAEAVPIAAVIQQRTYQRWREATGVHAPMVLAIVVDDVAVTAAARRWRLSNRRARSILVTALDRWQRC